MFQDNILLQGCVLSGPLSRSITDECLKKPRQKPLVVEKDETNHRYNECGGVLLQICTWSGKAQSLPQSLRYTQMALISVHPMRRCGRHLCQICKSSWHSRELGKTVFYVFKFGRIISIKAWSRYITCRLKHTSDWLSWSSTTKEGG